MISLLFCWLSHYATLSEHNCLRLMAGHRVKLLVRISMRWLVLLLSQRNLLRALSKEHGSKILICHLVLKALRLQKTLDLATEKPVKNKVNAYYLELRE